MRRRRHRLTQRRHCRRTERHLQVPTSQNSFASSVMRARVFFPCESFQPGLTFASKACGLYCKHVTIVNDDLKGRHNLERRLRSQLMTPTKPEAEAEAEAEAEMQGPVS